MNDLTRKALSFLHAALFTRRGLLILAGILAFSYAVVILVYVQSIPDIGLRSAFRPTIMGQAKPFEGARPEEGDEVTMVGDIEIKTWADLLNAPFHLRDSLRGISDTELAPELAEQAPLPAWAKKVSVEGTEATAVRIAFRKPGADVSLECWCVLGKLPLQDLVPSILWFILEVMLFSVGALVLWKRPTDTAAAQFFLLCIVTLGAFMGGYHWSHIATQPSLLLVFMVCAVLLPVVSLHFYLLFPKKNAGWGRTRSSPWRSSTGPPSCFWLP